MMALVQDIKNESVAAALLAPFFVTSYSLTWLKSRYYGFHILRYGAHIS